MSQLSLVRFTRRVPLGSAALLLLALVLNLAPTAPPVYAQGKGKPGGGGSVPPPPPVKYQIQFWSIPGAIEIDDIYDTNNSGQTVGSYRIDLDGDGVFDTWHGYLYDPEINAQWGVDLNDIVQNIPAGWSIRKATAINAFGQIAAYITPIDAPLSQVQAVVIDMNEELTTMYFLPDRDFTI